MFVRKWSALPPDPVFPSDLKSLGYFINKDDEVRSIENEDNYFKFFISRNSRVNDRQRFAMNQAIQDEIHRRLAECGLNKLFLPACTTDVPAEPNVPVFVSAGLAQKSRVVVIFGETHQDLGVLAHRVLGGPGGIEKGSLVSAVKALLRQHCSPTNPTTPGIVLANPGELVWWPEGRRTLSKSAFDASPMRSAAHAGNYIDPKANRVPGNESVGAHIKFIFETVVRDFVDPAAGLDIIGLGDGADAVHSYLNNNATWERVGGRINCFASVGGQFPVWELECDGLREFLKDRTRAYVPSHEPLGMVLSDPTGNPNTTAFTSLGCPVFSAGEQRYVETLFIASHTLVLHWLQEVADTSSEAEPYRNPKFTVFYSDGLNGEDDWGCSEEEGKDSSTVGDGTAKGELFVVPGNGVVAADELDQGKAESDKQEGTGLPANGSSTTLSALGEAMAAVTP